MKKRLETVADVKSGLVLSRKKADLASKTKYDYQVVSLKSFSESGCFDDSFNEEFETDQEVKEDYLVAKGDILVRLRHPFYAVYVEKECKNLIYSSHIARIRVHEDKLHPLYLTHFLNSIHTKKQIARESAGSIVNMVGLQSLKALTINLVEYEKQEKIVNFQLLSFKELGLLEQLKAEKQKLNKKLFEKMTS